MRKPARDSGFTLIEIMVVIALMGILATFGVGSWRAWIAASNQKGAVVDLQTDMRQTQVRAITEGVDLCIDFDTTAGAYTIYRDGRTAPTTPFTCVAPRTKINGPVTLPANVHMNSVVFTRLDGTSAGQIVFRASGRAWPGGLVIARDGSSKTYTMSVEGLTGRVSFS